MSQRSKSRKERKMRPLDARTVLMKAKVGLSLVIIRKIERRRTVNIMSAQDNALGQGGRRYNLSSNLWGCLEYNIASQTEKKICLARAEEYASNECTIHPTPESRNDEVPSEPYFCAAWVRRAALGGGTSLDTRFLNMRFEVSFR
jgi:hypothetical protein